MKELFKSDRGSFEYRSYENKCGVLIDPMSTRRFQLFVNESTIFLDKNELEILVSEIKKVLDKGS